MNTNDIKQGVSIFDMVSPSKYKKVKSGYICKCPLHAEKTESFFINKIENIFYCHGCKKGGSVIDFVMYDQNLSFVEAKNFLVKEHGSFLDTKSRGSAMRSSTNSNTNNNDSVISRVEYLALMHDADLYYRSQYGSAAKRLTENRQLTKSTVNASGIGQTKMGEWHGLYQNLKIKGHLDEAILEVGLISINKNGLPYDFLRNRIIFPIKDELGRTISFIGRVPEKNIDSSEFEFEHKQPKYINLKNSPHFKKGNHLFGEDQALDYEKATIIIEGPIDVISARQIGVRQIVGLMTSNVTDYQARKLSEKSRKVILCLDGDPAGVAGHLRSIKSLIKVGVEVKVAVLPQGSDPDRIIREKGSRAFKEILAESRAWLDYVSANSEADIVDYIRLIPSSIARKMYLHQVSESRPHFQPPHIQMSSPSTEAIILSKFPKSHLDDKNFDLLLRESMNHCGPVYIPYIFCGEGNPLQRISNLPDKERQEIQTMLHGIGTGKELSIA